MELTYAEKFIIRLLADIGEQLKAVTGNTGEFDFTYIKAALESGNTWALGYAYHVTGETYYYPPAVDEVRDILGMWEVIAESFEGLTDAERIALQDQEDPDFPGFDGRNDEEQLRIALFLIRYTDEFPMFKGRSLDSAPPGSLFRYRLMLPVFLKIYGSFERPALGSKLLALRQLLDLLRERRVSGSGLTLAPKSN